MFDWCGIALAGMLSSAAIEIHVAPQPGALGAEALIAPTLPRALDLLAARRADGDADAARILVHDGRHEITEAIVIDAALAGRGLFIGAAADSNPLISGGRIISGLRRHDDGTWRVVLDAVARGEWWFEEVFADLEPRIRARHPNTGYARVVAAGPDNRTSFTFDTAEIPAELVDHRSEVVFLHDWSSSRIRIAGVDRATDAIKLADPIGCQAPHYAITNFEPHPRYYIEGGASLVDAPGEWSLDRNSGEFVYLPRSGERIEAMRLIAPVAPALLKVTGSKNAPVSNVRIRGLDFAHVNWPIPANGYAEGQAAFYEARDDTVGRSAVPAAIEFSRATNCRLDDCTVSSVGGSGIWLGQSCRDCAVDDSIVRGAGANGIMIGETASRVVDGTPWWQVAPEQVATGNRVRHSLIERCGRRFFGAVGVWVGLTDHTTVANCEIRDLPYTGVSVGWRWDQTPTPCRANLIDANHIHHVMQVLSDGGGIYTLGRQPGTVLRGNAIHDIHRNAGRAPSNGMFLDQGTMDFLVEENIIWAIDTTPIRWHWTYENTVRNNTFVLREGQPIAFYNRAKADDIAYEDNRTPNEAGWTSEPARAIIERAGVRTSATFRWETSEQESVALLDASGGAIWRFIYGAANPHAYFHPLSLPGNRVLTVDRPRDHVHHHGVWFSWKLINGVNFWEHAPGTDRPAGRTEWDLVEAVTREDFSARIELALRYVLPDGELALRERRVMEISAPRVDGAFTIDWNAAFVAEADDVVLDRTPLPDEPGGKAWGGYAGLSARLTQLAARQACTLEGPVEFNRDDRARPQSNGFDYSGVIDGEPVGIAILSDPANLSSPSPWYAIRSASMTFFTPAVIAPGPHRLRRGERFNLRYRVVVHPQRWRAEELADAVRAWADETLNQ